MLSQVTAMSDRGFDIEDRGAEGQFSLRASESNHKRGLITTLWNCLATGRAGIGSCNLVDSHTRSVGFVDDVEDHDG
jgi:hypothetical protein